MGKFVCKQTSTGYVFNLKATNGQIIATSQVYKAEPFCRKGIESVRRNAPIAALEDQTVADFEVQKHPKFEVYMDKSGGYRFRLRATNGQIVAVSESYGTLNNCLNGVESVRKNAPDAPVEASEVTDV